MRLYYIGPRIDPAMTTTEIRAAERLTIDEIAEIIHGYLSLDTFEALIGLQHRSNAQTRAGEPLGDWLITRFTSEAAVRQALRAMGDPEAVADHFRISSVISCRSVFYGYDGQAFLLLRTEDPIPKGSPTILIEERADLLLESDYLDGAEAAKPD